MPSKTDTRILRILQPHISPIIGRSVLACAMKRAGVAESQLERGGVTRELISEIDRGLQRYGVDAGARGRCTEKLRGLARDAYSTHPPREGPSTVEIHSEGDIVKARVMVRNLAETLGFARTDQIKIATAVSEVARNVCQYAGEGRIVAEVVTGDHPRLQIVAEDRGPGIGNIEEILDGTYESRTGMGLGLRGCKRLMDEFAVSSGATGTTITMVKYL